MNKLEKSQAKRFIRMMIHNRFDEGKILDDENYRIAHDKLCDVIEYGFSLFDSYENIRDEQLLTQDCLEEDVRDDFFEAVADMLGENVRDKLYKKYREIEETIYTQYNKSIE